MQAHRSGEGQIIAVIPARGGSKRIPRKNVRLFAGRPLIAYSIDAAVRSQLFDHVIVSTDDEEIASIAREYGAETPFTRPLSLADDHTPTVPIVSHALRWVESHVGAVSSACCIYATAPFLRSQDLIEAHGLLQQERVEGYVFSATAFSAPIQRAFRLRRDSQVEMFDPTKYQLRSQDLEVAFHDAAQFYWGSSAAYLNETMFFSANSRAYLIPRHRVQDIDTEEDWIRAELMYDALKKRGDLL